MDIVTSSAVLVQISGPDPKQLKTKHHQFFTVESGTTTLSCSGFVLNPQQIITSAWLVAPFLKEQQQEGDDTLVYGTRIHCVGENGVKLEATLHSIRRFATQAAATEWHDARVRGVSQFDVAVLTCEQQEWPAVTSFAGAFPSSSSARNQRGKPVNVVSSAFGLVYPKVFRNSITKGVLCNVLNAEGRGGGDQLYFTDARCAAGSEGAPVFINNGQFLGMVLPALQDRAQMGQKFELSAVLPWHVICGGGGEEVLTTNPVVAATSNVLVEASHSVPLLRIGQNWGSGVLVHVDHTKKQGYILTCAHVVCNAQITTTQVHVQFRHGGELLCRRIGQIKFSSDGPVDIAIVIVGNLPDWVSPIELSSHSVRAGDECSAIGFSIFEPSGPVGGWATISTGNVCRVVDCDDDGQACLLQTCTPVFRGHSGGMLSDSEGKLMGIITSNAKQSNGAIIPEINFAIPISFLFGMIQEITNDSYLQEFNAVTKQSAMLRSIWSLSPPPSVDHDEHKQANSNFYAFFDKFRQSRL